MQKICITGILKVSGQKNNVLVRSASIKYHNNVWWIHTRC